MKSIIKNIKRRDPTLSHCRKFKFNERYFNFDVFAFHEQRRKKKRSTSRRSPFSIFIALSLFLVRTPYPPSMPIYLQQLDSDEIRNEKE